tara:strand:- start:634 stop:840 length:207 start_codon:yes stop_codon:yes gene_type:complete
MQIILTTLEPSGIINLSGFIFSSGNKSSILIMSSISLSASNNLTSGSAKTSKETSFSSFERSLARSKI